MGMRENPYRFFYIVLAFLLIVHNKGREPPYNPCLICWCGKKNCWKRLWRSYWVLVRDFCGFHLQLNYTAISHSPPEGLCYQAACTPAAQQLCLQQAQSLQKALTGFVIPKCQQPHPQHPNPSLSSSDFGLADIFELCLCSSVLWQWCIMLKAISRDFRTSM